MKQLQKLLGGVSLVLALVTLAPPGYAQNTPVGAGASGVAQGSTTAGQKGGLSQCATTTAAPAYTTAQTNPCSNDPNGGQRTLLQDSTGNAVSYTTTVPTGPTPYPNKNVSGTATAATPETASSGNVAAASAVATLATGASVTTYISGFQCTGSGATVGSVVNVTVAGVITGTMTYTFAATAGALLSDPPLTVQFNPAIPASAPNTTIVVTMPSLGTGNTNAACSAQGYTL